MINKHTEERIAELNDSALTSRDYFVSELKKLSVSHKEIAFLCSRVAKLYLLSDDGIGYIARKHD